jgi:hypothetical protein
MERRQRTARRFNPRLDPHMKQHQISDKTLLLLFREQLRRLRSLTAQIYPALNEGNESEDEKVRRLIADLYYLDAAAASGAPSADIPMASIDKGTVESIANRCTSLEKHLRAMITIPALGEPSTVPVSRIQHHLNVIIEISNELKDRYR